MPRRPGGRRAPAQFTDEQLAPTTRLTVQHNFIRRISTPGLVGALEDIIGAARANLGEFDDLHDKSALRLYLPYGLGAIMLAGRHSVQTYIDGEPQRMLIGDMRKKIIQTRPSAKYPLPGEILGVEWRANPEADYRQLVLRVKTPAVMQEMMRLEPLNPGRWSRQQSHEGAEDSVDEELNLTLFNILRATPRDQFTDAILQAAGEQLVAGAGVTFSPPEPVRIDDARASVTFPLAPKK